MRDKILHMSELFKLLSNDVRLCILINLCKSEEKKVADLQECAGVSQSLISQQLAKLRTAGVIKANKISNEVYYSLKNEEIKEIINKLIL